MAPPAHLGHEEILRLYEAAVSATVAGDRRGLLTGLPEAFVASLPLSSKPGEQTLTDLGALNAAGALEDGTVRGAEAGNPQVHVAPGGEDRLRVVEPGREADRDRGRG